MVINMMKNLRSNNGMMVVTTVLLILAMIMVPLSVDASLCSSTVACHGIEKCNDAGVCRCPWVGLAADGHLSSSGFTSSNGGGFLANTSEYWSTEFPCEYYPVDLYPAEVKFFQAQGIILHGTELALSLQAVLRLWKSDRFRKNIQSLAISMMICSSLLYFIHYCMNPYGETQTYEGSIVISYLPAPITVSLYNVTLLFLRNLTSRHLNDVKNAQKNSVIAVILSLFFLIAFLLYTVAARNGSIYLIFWIVYLVLSILVSTYIGVKLLQRLRVTIQPSPYQLRDVNVEGSGSGNSGSGNGSARIQPSPPSPVVNNMMAQPSPKGGSTTPGATAPTNTNSGINAGTTMVSAPAPPPVIALAAPLKLSPMGLTIAVPPLVTSPSVGGRNINGSSLYSPANGSGAGVNNNGYTQQNVSMYYGASAQSVGYGSTPINSPNNAGMNYAAGVATGGKGQPPLQAPVRLSGNTFASASEALRKRILFFLVGSSFCSVCWLISLLVGTRIFNGNTFNEQFGQYLVFRYFEAAWSFILLKTFWPHKIGSYTVNVRRNGNAPSGGSGKGSGNNKPAANTPIERPKPGPHIMAGNNNKSGSDGKGGRPSRGSNNGTPTNANGGGGTPIGANANIVAAFNANGSSGALNTLAMSPANSNGALTSPMGSPVGTPVQNSARRYISNPDSPGNNGATGVNGSPRANAAIASYHARASVDRGMNGTLFGMIGAPVTAGNTPVGGNTPIVSPTNAHQRGATSPNMPTTALQSPDSNPPVHAINNFPHSSMASNSLAATTSGGHNNNNNGGNVNIGSVSESGTERIAL